MTPSALHYGPRSCVCAILALLAAACGTTHPAKGPPAAPPLQLPMPAATSLVNLPPGSYHVDAARSELRVLVYRAGTLARLGHNHVLVNHSVDGILDGSRDPVLELRVPVTGFLVDEDYARREEGADFPADVPDDAKVGTLKNLLGPAVLNAAGFPDMRVACTAVRYDGATWSSDVTLLVAGHRSTRHIPFTLRQDGGDLFASGIVELRQTELGLVPYSLAMGALSVDDRIVVKFSLAASR